tara:strand:+ start:169 stop:690 length:522 start_codon:yes stop_codon:yes gene_type:complete
MGYDMYKLNLWGEPATVETYEDSNYFRLNIWGMGRARELACWGYGLVTAGEQLQQDAIIAMIAGKTLEEFEPSDYQKALLHLEEILKESEMTNHWDKEARKTYAEEYESFLEPWECNGNLATESQCKIFAEGIEMALDLINSQSIIPEALSNLEIFSEFAEWLRESPHGVFVG